MEDVIKKKKIVIFHHCDQIGGAGMSLCNGYKMLCDRYNVIIYVPKKEGNMYQYLHKEGICCKVIGEGVGQINAYSGGPSFFQKDFYLKYLKILKTYRIIQRIIKNEMPDLIILNSVTISWMAKCGYKLGIPTIGYIRETYVDTLFMKQSLRFLDKYASGVVFISKYDLEHYKTTVNAKTVVRNCVLDKEVEYLGREKACEIIGVDNNKFNILFVGGTRAKALKGFPTLVSASEFLHGDEYSFLICGDIAEPINLDRFIELGIRKDMIIVYQAADLLVFPAGFPHQARPAFEAGLYKIPVVISDFEEIKDDVIDGHNGLLFSASNAKELAYKILYLKNNKADLERMGENNYKMCIEKHSFDNCKEELIRFIEGRMA